MQVSQMFPDKWFILLHRWIQRYFLQLNFCLLNNIHYHFLVIWSIAKSNKNCLRHSYFWRKLHHLHLQADPSVESSGRMSPSWHSKHFRAETKVPNSEVSLHREQSHSKNHSFHSSSCLFGLPSAGGTYWIVISSPSKISLLARRTTVKPSSGFTANKDK